MSRREPKRLWRTSIHESAHAVMAVYLGFGSVAATVTPGADFGGLVWTGGDPELPDGYSASTEEDEHILHSAKIRSVLPPPGSPRDCIEPVLVGIHNEVVFAMAAPAGEELFFGGACRHGCSRDLARARSLAGQICSSPASVDAFVSWAHAESKAILQAHRGAILTVATALLKHRTITATAHINHLIDMGERREYLHSERQRRRRMQEAARSAAQSKHLFEQPAAFSAILKQGNRDGIQR